MYLAKMSEGSKTVVTDVGGLEWDHVGTSKIRTHHDQQATPMLQTKTT